MGPKDGFDALSEEAWLTEICSDKLDLFGSEGAERVRGPLSPRGVSTDELKRGTTCSEPLRDREADSPVRTSHKISTPRELLRKWHLPATLMTEKAAPIEAPPDQQVFKGVDEPAEE